MTRHVSRVVLGVAGCAGATALAMLSLPVLAAPAVAPPGTGSVPVTAPPSPAAPDPDAPNPDAPSAEDRRVGIVRRTVAASGSGEFDIAPGRCRRPGRARCPGPGRPAPVMQQQTLGLHGCTQNSWPYP